MNIKQGSTPEIRTRASDRSTTTCIHRINTSNTAGLTASNTCRNTAATTTSYCRCMRFAYSIIIRTYTAFWSRSVPKQMIVLAVKCMLQIGIDLFSFVTGNLSRPPPQAIPPLVLCRYTRRSRIQVDAPKLEAQRAVCRTWGNANFKNVIPISVDPFCLQHLCDGGA